MAAPMKLRVRDPKDQHLPQDVREGSSDPDSRRLRARGVGALVVGGAALGAVAIGALAIGRLAIGRARIKRLEIDELVVRHLRVTDEIETPNPSAPRGTDSAVNTDDEMD